MSKESICADHGELTSWYNRLTHTTEDCENTCSSANSYLTIPRHGRQEVFVLFNGSVKHKFIMQQQL